MDISCPEGHLAVDDSGQRLPGRGREAARLMPDGERILVLTYAHRQPHQELAALGGHGCGQGGKGRLGAPADIGKAAALLCSEEAGWITRQVNHADSGVSLINPWNYPS